MVASSVLSDPSSNSGASNIFFLEEEKAINIACVAWSAYENKVFENGLVLYEENDEPEKWRRIAEEIPGKSHEEVRKHYERLLEDVEMIESGFVPVPCYVGERSGGERKEEEEEKVEENYEDRKASMQSDGCKESKKRSRERKKAVPWTEEEHRSPISLFLLSKIILAYCRWRMTNFVVLMPIN